MTDDRLSHKRTGASAVDSRSTDTEPDSAAPQTPPIPHADSGADSSPVTAADPGFDALGRLTSARIGLGRSGTSLPTRALLDFQFAHAQARDAVHTPLDTAALTDALTAKGIAYVQVKSAATDRDTYLKRPDLGRRLDADAAKQLVDAAKALYNAAAPLQETDESLQKIAKSLPETDESLQTAAESSRMAAGKWDDAPNTEAASPDVCIVVADGLSARAIHQHAAEMVGRILAFCKEEGWTCAPIVIVEQGRVAIADEIGELIGARMSAILIGERPGLSSPDSLGIYFTYGPKTGLSDAARNCLSNIRPEGQNYTLAAHRLRYLMQQATQRKLSGVVLKDEAEIPTVGTSVGNFLLD